MRHGLERFLGGAQRAVEDTRSKDTDWFQKWCLSTNAKSTHMDVKNGANNGEEGECRRRGCPEAVQSIKPQSPALITRQITCSKQLSGDSQNASDHYTVPLTCYISKHQSSLLSFLERKIRQSYPTKTDNFPREKKKKTLHVLAISTLMQLVLPVSLNGRSVIVLISITCSKKSTGTRQDYIKLLIHVILHAFYLMIFSYCLCNNQQLAMNACTVSSYDGHKSSFIATPICTMYS